MAVLLLGGCDGFLGEPTGRRPYLLTENAFSFNGLLANGLLANGLRMNGLRMNGLRMNGLAVDNLSFNDLPADQSLSVLSYIASCALGPADTLTMTIGGVAQPFPGGLGLVPDFTTTGIDTDDKEQRISACLMARTNAIGKHVSISLVGFSTLRQGPAESDYFLLEASYWGNIFIPGAYMNVCTTPSFRTTTSLWLDGTFQRAGRSCMAGAGCGFAEFDCNGSSLQQDPATLNGITVFDSTTELQRAAAAPL
jgi:hypothetical protein